MFTGILSKENKETIVVRIGGFRYVPFKYQGDAFVILDEKVGRCIIDEVLPSIKEDYNLNIWVDSMPKGYIFGSEEDVDFMIKDGVFVIKVTRTVCTITK